MRLTSVFVLLLICSCAQRVDVRDADLGKFGDAVDDVHVFPNRQIVVQYGERIVTVPKSTEGRIIGQARVGEAAMLFVCFDVTCNGPDDAYRFMRMTNGTYRLTRAPVRPSLPPGHMSAAQPVTLQAKKQTSRVRS